MAASVYIVLMDAPPYYLTFSEGNQPLCLPVFGFLFVSQGSGACSKRISWRAKRTYKGVGFFYWEERGWVEGKWGARGVSELYLEVHLFTIKLLTLP